MPHIGIIDPFIFDASAPVLHLAFEGPLTQFECGSPDGAVVAGPSVDVLDAGNNIVDTFVGDITLAFGNNPGGAALSGTLTVAVSGGVANFDQLGISLAGAGCTLVASAPGTTPGTSDPFDITIGAYSVCGVGTSGTYLFNASPAVPIFDSRYGLLMVWANEGGVFMGMFDVADSPVLISQINQLTIRLSDGSSAQVRRSGSADFFPAGDGNWHQLIVSFDTFAQVAQVMTDGALLGDLTPTWGTATTAKYSDMSYLGWGWVNPPAPGGNCGLLSDAFYAIPGTFFDLGLSINVDKLRAGGGGPLPISGSPSSVTGSPPLVLFHGGPSTYGANFGDAGDFTVGGPAFETTKTSPWP